MNTVFLLMAQFGSVTLTMDQIRTLLGGRHRRNAREPRAQDLARLRASEMSARLAGPARSAGAAGAVRRMIIHMPSHLYLLRGWKLNYRWLTRTA